MNKQELLKLLPHNVSGLKIDKIIEVNLVAREVTALKMIPDNDVESFEHCPESPMVPGVSIIESMAQTASVIEYLGTEKKKLLKLVEIKKARFKIPVIPGDEVLFLVKLIKKKRNFLFFQGEAHVGNNLVVSAEFTAGY